MYHVCMVRNGSTLSDVFGDFKKAWRKLCFIVHNDPAPVQILNNVWQLSTTDIVYIRGLD